MPLQYPRGSPSSTASKRRKPFSLHDFRGEPCGTPGCERVITSKWATCGLCNRCKLARRRHGDARQTSLSVTELRPLLHAIGEVRRRNPQADFSSCAAEWMALVGDHEAGLLDVDKQRRDVAELVCGIGKAVAPDRLLDLVAAVHLCRLLDQQGQPEDGPSPRFQTANCFKLAVVYVCRREGSVEVVRSKASGVAYYRDISHSARFEVYDLLSKAFGKAGEKLASIEATRRAQEAAREAALNEAIAVLA